MKLSNIVTIYSNTASLSVRNCFFCLHIWKYAACFFYRQGRKARRLEIFTPSTREGQVFSHYFRWCGVRRQPNHSSGMTLQEFQSKIESIRAQNGWTITLECHGIWIVTVFDKESGVQLACTGSTGLYGILRSLEMPFDKCPWV